MKTKKCPLRCFASKGRLIAYPLAALLLLMPALFLQSCKSIRQTASVERRDSTEIRERLTIAPATIPMSRVEIPIPILDLRSLPMGASYTARQGQATVSAEMRGDILLVSATCDSLQQLVYNYERDLKSMANVVSQLTEESSPCPSPLKWFAYGALAGILFAFGTVLIIKFSK